MPTVAITGAEQGLGLELARAYASDGFEVVAGCLRPDAPGVQALLDQHPAVVVAPLDVTKEGSVAAFADRFADKPLDVLNQQRRCSFPQMVGSRAGRLRRLGDGASGQYAGTRPGLLCPARKPGQSGAFEARDNLQRLGLGVEPSGDRL